MLRSMEASEASLQISFSVGVFAFAQLKLGFDSEPEASAWTVGFATSADWPINVATFLASHMS